MIATSIRRGFADVAHGQIHYRTVGDGTPLLLLHASPGSSKQMLGLIDSFAADARVIAPDTPGNGDSVPLSVEPEITDLAHAMLGFIDAIGVDRVRLYGSHTGAAIATELAILAPGRIERLVLDGVQLLSDEAREAVLIHYALPFPPDLDGAYLMRAFMFCRDQYLFYPWYDRTVRGQRVGGLPKPHDLHNWVVEVLKANESYHLNYRAAFRWKALDRVPLVTCPVLVITAENDPLADDSRQVVSALKDATFVNLPRFDAPDYSARRKAAMTDFLDL